jgi:AcrR family transcriptional regulator
MSRNATGAGEAPGADRRVRRTRGALARALLQLASEKPYPEVTIREVCDRADVAYATFFRHYPSKEGLVLQVVSEVVEDMARLLEPVADAGRLAEAGRRLFRYVAEHRSELSVLFAAARVSTIDLDLRNEVVARILESPGFRPPRGVPRELAAQLHGHALGEVARLVDVAAQPHRHLVGEQLQRDHVDDRREQLGDPGHVRTSSACAAITSSRRWRRDDEAVARAHLLQVRHGLVVQLRRAVAIATTGRSASISAIGPCFISPVGYASAWR